MGTSIIVCGQAFDIGTKVVLWNEPGGLNAYGESTKTFWEEDRKTGKSVKTTVSGKRYNKRSWKTLDLPGLQNIVTQFFIHHSGMYHSKDTFNVLHNERKLSVHFILDDNGTLYQTLDLVENAWHGGKCNGFSVGIEVDSRALATKLPTAYDAQHQSQYNVQPHKQILDKVQKMFIVGYEFTDAQYKTLICLGKVLTDVFPKMKTSGLFVADFPRDSKGRIVREALTNPKDHKGFICHYQTSENKIDPIAFDHCRFLSGVTSNNPEQPPAFHVFDDWRARQEALRQMGYEPGPVDGIFGPKTDAAMKAFQKANGISEDSWGPKTTWAADWNLKVVR